MEKFQYGMQVTYQVEEILQEFKTSKTHVKYVRTKYHGDMLLMDDEIQFSTLDEHRYHELLVPPEMSYGESVLILGGGDGLALRNIYREDPNVKRCVVVDYDKEFVEKFAKEYPYNEGSLVDPRTILVYMDAVQFLRIVHEKYDTVIIDLPDPDNTEMQELYFKIIRSIPRVMHNMTEVSCHIGPVSLCKEHPNWTFIKKFVKEIEEYQSILRTQYIPSFSHEWGVISFSMEYMSDDDIHISEDIEEIYKNL